MAPANQLAGAIITSTSNSDQDQTHHGGGFNLPFSNINLYQQGGAGALGGFSMILILAVTLGCVFLCWKSCHKRICGCCCSCMEKHSDASARVVDAGASAAESLGHLTEASFRALSARVERLHEQVETRHDATPEPAIPHVALPDNAPATSPPPAPPPPATPTPLAPLAAFSPVAQPTAPPPYHAPYHAMPMAYGLPPMAPLPTAASSMSNIHLQALQALQAITTPPAPALALPNPAPPRLSLPKSRLDELEESSQV